MVLAKVTRQQLRQLRRRRDEGPADQFNEAHSRYADAFAIAPWHTAIAHIAEELIATLRGQRH